MDLRSQTSLLGSVVSLAIAATVLLRPRKRRVHWLFALFDLTVSAWYGTTFLARWASGTEFWGRLNLVFAVLLPLASVQFFRAFLLTDSRRASQLNRLAVFLAGAMVVAVFTPLHPSIILGTLVFTYVFVLLGASLGLVYRAGQRARSRFDGARLNYLALVGAFAAVFTLAEYLPYVGLEIPPFGTVLILVFLYVLSQSLLRYRLLDLYELGARLLILTALSFTLAGILWVLVWLDPGNFYLHSVVAAIVLLITFEPVYARVEERISQIFLRERADLERLATSLRRQLAGTLSLDEVVRAVVEALEQSRRVTHGAFYLLDPERMGYDLRGHVGPMPRTRVDHAPARAFLERLARDGMLVLENLERERDERTELGDDKDARLVREHLDWMRDLGASVVLAVQGEAETSYGFLCLRDERLRDAYTPEELEILRGVASQLARALESSRLYERLRDRDRLAALGEMSAGLAHEIRNPLGSIKASAQFLSEAGDETNREFLGIIVEEVDRLNRVVSSFLDYARPSANQSTAAIDVTSTIERTLQLLTPDLGAGIEVDLQLTPELPRVSIDPERLRQVLINLILNAAQAMDGNGRLVVRTVRPRTDPDASGRQSRMIEIQVTDTGPGLPARVRENLFVPFVTTKDRGTGLGLAISQRIITAAGGRIEARGGREGGTTFTVTLPTGDASLEASGELRQGASESTPPPRDGAGDSATTLASDR